MAAVESITGIVQVVGLMMGFNGADATGLLNFSIIGLSDPMTVVECENIAREHNSSVPQQIPGQTFIIVCSPYINPDGTQTEKE